MREIIIIVIFAGFLSRTYGLSCLPCSNITCETPACNSSGYALGICGCCDVCAIPYNSSCGGLWNSDGTCDKNLTCTAEQLKQPSFSKGTCVDSHCRAIIDVIWAMDGSTSKGEENFKILKKFLLDVMMKIYDKFGACAHVEILQYSNKDSVAASVPIEDSTQFQIPFSLGECINNVDCIQRRLDEMKYFGGPTYTGFALERIREVEFKKSSRAQRSKKVVIVATGGSAVDRSILSTWYMHANPEGIIPFAIGIGGNSDLELLRAIANGGESDERVFSIDSFSNLNIANVAKVLVNGIWNETVHENTQQKALLEIIFVIDGSGSIGESNFAIVKEWLINQTLNIYEAFGNSARVEVLQYSNKDNPWDGVSIGDSKKFVIPFVLGECVNNASCFTSRIMSMPYLNSATYTYYALRRVMEVEFPKSPSYATSTKAVIVMNDGEANDGAFLRGWHDKYKHMLHTIAIGIGNYETFLNQLQNIANGGTGNDRVFTYADFGALRGSSSDIIIALINSTSSCVDPFVGNACPSYCPATCDDPNPTCTQVCAPPGCTCPKGHLLSKSDNGTTCVLPENCPAKKCIFPEVHTNCALPCLKTCSDPKPICPEMCLLNQCVCAEGYIRKSATNLTCIQQDDCPEPCEPKNCGIIPLCFQPNCPAYPSATCKSNYSDCTQWYEDDFGRRVDCNNDICQYPMIRSDCGSACPTTCETVNADYPIACTLQCIVGACVCPKGMILRSLTDRVCVTPGNCTKPPTVCPYPKIFQICPSACPATCDNPEPGVCTKNNSQCAENRCVCPPDHVLYNETDRRCVHSYECPVEANMNNSITISKRTIVIALLIAVGGIWFIGLCSQQEPI